VAVPPVWRGLYLCWEAGMASLAQRNLQAWIAQREFRVQARLSEAQKVVRHKCFISYHQADIDEVTQFIEAFEDVFIPQVIGVSDDDDFIDSADTEYVMNQIREKYLTNSTVTIVLVGKCTWARRYVDWEVYSSLRDDKNNKRSGLLAITLPSAASYSGRRLPPRADDNVHDADGYARWYKYPTSTASLQRIIDEAFDARISKAGLIDNTRARKLYNSSCP
jgi:hypothetical protein